MNVAIQTSGWLAVVIESPGQLAKNELRFVHNLSHDVAGWLNLRHQADALSGPEREGIDVAFDIGHWRIGLIANDRSARSRLGDDFSFAWPFSGCGPPRGLPSFDGFVSKRAVGRIRPSHIKQ